jgi:hypothetical protein
MKGAGQVIAGLLEASQPIPGGWIIAAIGPSPAAAPA